MNRIFCIVALLVLTATGCKAQNKESVSVQWTPITEAAQTNIEENEKLFFVDFSTSWCGWCKKMDRETFSDPVVASILNKFYIPIHFDAEGNDEFTWLGTDYLPGKVVNGRPGTHSFTRATLGTRIGYPSFAIFSPDMRLIQMFEGYRNSGEFSMILWYICSMDYTRYTWEQYQDIFDTQIRPKMMKSIDWKAAADNADKPVQIYHE